MQLINISHIKFNIYWSLNWINGNSLHDSYTHYSKYDWYARCNVKYKMSQYKMKYSKVDVCDQLWNFNLYLAVHTWYVCQLFKLYICYKIQNVALLIWIDARANYHTPFIIHSLSHPFVTPPFGTPLYFSCGLPRFLLNAYDTNIINQPQPISAIGPTSLELILESRVDMGCDTHFAMYYSLYRISFGPVFFNILWWLS